MAVVVYGVTGVGQAGTELAPGVVECLVERPPGGREALGEHVDGHAVERESTEDLALVHGQRAADRGDDRAQEIGVLDGLLRAWPAVGQMAPALALERHFPALPRAPPGLYARLQQHEL